MRERGRLLKREREGERKGSKREREKQMCQNCMPTMNVNTLCKDKDHNHQAIPMGLPNISFRPFLPEMNFPVTAFAPSCQHMCEFAPKVGRIRPNHA